jgi:protein phosphatase
MNLKLFSRKLSKGILLLPLLLIAMGGTSVFAPSKTVGLIVSYDIRGGGSPSSQPDFAYYQNGILRHITLSRYPKTSTVIVDLNTTWITQNPLAGQTQDEQWSVAENKGVAVANATLTIIYFHQLAESVSYKTLYGDSRGNRIGPTLTVFQYGGLNTTTLTIAPTLVWVDDNTSWSVETSLFGSSAMERWWYAGSINGTISSPGSLIFYYSHQFPLLMTVDPVDISSTYPTIRWENASSSVEILANVTRVGYTFQRWIGIGSGSYSGADNPAHVTVNGLIKETAYFKSSVEIVIVTINGTQSVLLDGAALTLNSSAIIVPWYVNSTHTINALPGSACGLKIGPMNICEWQFKGWYSQDGTLISNSNPLQLTAEKTKTIVGVWEKSYLTLEILSVCLAVIAAVILLLVRKSRKRSHHSPNAPTIVPDRQSHELQYVWGTCTDVGRVRSNNEDSVLAMEILSSIDSRSVSNVLCAIADGVGGNQKGEVASKLALQILAAKVSTSMIGRTKTELREILKSAIEEANEAVVTYGMEHSESEGMATTIVAALVHQNTVSVAHVGDSRAYLINRGEIKQLTKDDSQVQELVDERKLTPEQARHFPARNIITKAVGAAADIEVSTSSLFLAPGDRILLCSDGLWEAVTDTEIQRIVFDLPTPQLACNKLVSLANERYGKDNVSVVIVEIQKKIMRK